MSIDYSKSKMFKITCLITNDVFIGSTTNTLINRLSGLKSPDSNCVSKAILDRGSYEIDLIEDFVCKSKRELRIRTKYWCDRIENINLKEQPYCKPDRTEYFKNYQLENKEKIDIYRKENMERVKIRRKEIGNTYSYKYTKKNRLKNIVAYNAYMKIYNKRRRENSWEYISKVFYKILRT